MPIFESADDILRKYEQGQNFDSGITPFDERKQRQNFDEKHALQPLSPDVPQGQALDGSSAQLRERTEEGIDNTPIPRVKLQHKYNKPEQQGTINPYGEGGLTGRQLSNLRRSFSEDPLLCIEDNETREKVESIAATFGVEDGERIKKAVALAHYYSMGHRDQVGEIFNNLDVAIELFEGKKMTVDQAYESVKQLYEPQQEGIWGNRGVAAATAGVAEVGKTAANAASFLGRRLTESGQIVAITGAGLYSGLLRLIGADGKAARVWESAKDSLLSRDYGKEWEDAVQKELAKPIETVETWAQQNMKVPENWVTDSESVSDWVENAGLSLLNYAPQLGAQLTLMTATGGVSSLGLVYGINGYYDIKGDLPEISEEKALLYGLGIGLINGALENVSLGIVEGKVAEHFASNGIKKGMTRILEYLGASALMEGAEESLEEFTENVLDIAMGRRGDKTDWTSKDWTDNLFRGMPEAFFLGFTTGFGMAGLNVKPLREKAELNQKVRNYAEKRKSDLDAKETMTKDEELEYNVLSAALDSNDPNRVLHAANVVSLNAKLRQQQEQNAAQKRYNEAEERFSKAQEELNAISARPTQDAKNRNTAVTKYRAAKAELDAAKADLDAARKDFVKAFPEEETIEERAIREAEEVRIARDLKRRIPWHLQDTVDKVNDLAKSYTAIPIHAVNTFDELPEAARREAEARGLDKSKADAVWSNGEVYVIADKTRPSDVEKRILHEVVGHAGLRRVFGKDFDAFLDDVFARHSKEIEEMGLSALYNTKPDTVEGRRYLADEFLAKLAESDVKPSWWKELLAQIRTYLRNMFPGIHFSDADIEVALVRSARAMRREQELSDVAPESRFALIGSSGAISNLGRDNPNREINLDNAEKATRMRDYGYSDKEIWLATGWTRGADGQWRMEIPDLNVKTDELTQGDNYNALIDYNGPLDGYVDAPEIFEAYPQLKQYNVMFIPLPRGEAGYFDRANNTIAINRTLFVDQNFDVLNDMAADMKEAKTQHEADIIHANIKEELDTFAEGIRNTLIHEVQHAIQQIEGFARGGNLEDAKNLPDDLDPMFVRANTQLSELEQRYNDAFDKLIQAEAYLDWSDEMSLALSRYVGSNPKSSDLEIIRNGAAGNPHLDSFIEALEHFKRVDFEKNVANLDVVSSKGSFGRYRRFAGEVEARNAEQRAAMSDERRRETMPSETEDVPRENQIVRFSVSPVWTGSAADFEQPSLHYVGTGEGNQVYGWGLYGSAERGVGEEYAKADFNRKNPEDEFSEEYQDPTGKRHLYKQTFWPDKQEDLLDWDEDLPESQAEKIITALEKDSPYELVGEDKQHGKIFKRKKEIPLHNYIFEKDIRNETGEGVYNLLLREFFTPKAASEFLYRAGIDGVTYIGGSSGVRNYVAFSDKDIRVDEHIRFSLENYSEEDKQQLVTLLKPKWIEEAFVEPSEVKAFLESVGETGIDENDAWALYHMAGSEIRAEKKKADDKKRDNWIYENDLLYHDAVDYGGLDFKIIPSLRFLDNDEWPGTFIADSWRKRGKKRPQGKNESGLRYHEYLRRREAELTSEHQTGITSDDLAKYIARIRGGDELDIEEQIIEHFRYMNRPKLWSQYHDYKKEQNYRNKIEQNEAEEEFAQYKAEQIQQKVEELLANKGQITEEWAIANPDVFAELYRLLMKEEPPKSRKPSKENLEAINAALANEDVNAATYKAVRRALTNQFQQRLTALRQEMNDKGANAIKLQRDAAVFAEENLPPELRGMFTRGIIKLLDYGTSPSKNFPEGRRMHEFYQLQDEILKASQTKRTEDSIGHIREMLDAVKMKRNWKGILVSVIPSEQARVERIRKIIDMSAASVANAIEYNNSRILELEAGIDASFENGEAVDISAEMDKLVEDNALLELFGNLEYRKPDSVLKAEDFLQDLIKGGKAKFKSLLAQQAGRVMVMRQQAVSEITGGKNTVATGGAVESKDAKNHTPYILKNMHLGSLLRLVAAKAGIDFDSTVAGKLWISTEKSTQKEMTANRHLQEDFDAELNDTLGTSGQGKMAQMRKKGRFLKGLSKVEQKTGVFKTQFSRQKVIDPFDAPIVQVGRSSSKIHLIPVEDYTRRVQNEDGTFEEIKCPGVRSILRAIDNGGAYEIGDGVNLDETGVWMLRKQLEDYDAGIDRRLDFFVDEIDKESAKKLEADSEKDKLAVIFRGKNVESKKVEVPLSQGTALQILLTWEQEDYRANMKWNGWTEESIEQIKKFLKPETLRLGYWMRDYFAKQRGELDEAVVKRYGAHLPENQNYWPGRFSGSRTSIGTGGMRGAGTMNINPSFLIARKFHLNPLDMDVDAFSVFFDGQIKQNHFLAWTDTIRDMREVFGDTSVQDAINENFGKDVTKNLVERIVTIAQGGRENNGFISSLFSRLNRYWVPAKIAINPSSYIKQGLGVLAYMNNMPVDEYVKYMSRANTSNADYKAFVQMALNSDYLKNRMAGGLDKDLIYLMQNTRDTAPYSPLAESLVNFATYMTKRADRWSALHGGFAVYQYNLDQARKSGLSEKDAQERARRAWMRATDETQQSGYLKDLNYFQQNQGIVRFYTAFLSNPIQVMNLQLQTLNDIKYNSDNEAAKKKLAKQIFVNHVVVMTLMQFTTDMVRAGFNPGDWWEDAEFEDYFTAWLFGPFEGLFMIGKEGESAVNWIANKLFGRKSNTAQPTSAVQVVDEGKRNFDRVWNDLKDGEISQKDIADGLAFAGDLGMLYGATPAPGAAGAGSVGAVTNAAGSLYKKILKAYEDDEDGKKTTSKRRRGGGSKRR